MLRYSGMTFKMVDSEGVSHEVKQVSAPVAKKTYEDNKPVWLHPCNMKVSNPWHNPYCISKAHITDPFALRISEFDRVVEAYQYYNCDNERGKYPIFFVAAA